MTGPKNTLAKSEEAVITEDFATDNQTWNGLAEGYATLAGKNVARDTGEITFDTNGNIVSEHGQHPIAEGPGNDAVCTALSS